jgi:fluoride exporter
VKVLGVAAGGALGAVLRWWLGELFPDDAGFPWTTFVINVTGAGALAALPALELVRRRAGLAAALGPGVLGGYTTLSAASEQTRALLADDRIVTGATYAVGTLVACLVVVAVVSGFATPEAREGFAAQGGDE